MASKSAGENDQLITKRLSLSDEPSSSYDGTSKSSFVLATSFAEEIKLTMTRCLLMSLQMVSQLGVVIVVIVFVGQLPDSALYLAGVGFGRSLVNVTGTAMAWGLTTALFTLLPQSIGAGQHRHCAIHVQRAFYVVTVAACFLSIAQFYAGDLIVAIGQPAALKPIVSLYCRVAIPYIFVTAYASILQRLLQALDLNPYVTACSSLMLIMSPLSSWFFILHQGWYYGAAITSTLSLLVFIIGMVIIVIRSGYGFVFKPLPISTVLTRKGVSEYISLAVPGLFQNAFEWIIQEVAVILAGYVTNSTIALSATVILANLMYLVMAFMAGIANATNVRVGKYIGRADIIGAKRAAKVGVILAILINTVFGMIFILGRDALPGIYTDNEETLALTSSMMIILWVYAAGCIILNVFGGVYRGMGIQKIAAVMVFVSYWVISFPLSLILLFGFNLRQNLFYGSFLIWGSLAIGNILGCIAEIVYLGFWADWKFAVHKAMLRVRHTMSDVMNTKYKSTDNCNALQNGNGMIQITE